MMSVRSPAVAGALLAAVALCAWTLANREELVASRRLRGEGAEGAAAANGSTPGVGVRQSAAGGDGVTRTRALALAGGGFRAFSVDIALMAGLVAARARKRGVAPTFAETTPLDRFQTLSTVSGGTWFTSSLVFSARFRAMIERMAAAPNASGLEFHNDWMQAWISTGRRTLKARSEDDEVDLVKAFGGKSVGSQGVFEQDLREVSYFWRRGLSWNDYVHTMLSVASSVDSLHSMGDAVEPWLAGKAWLVCHSLALGTAEKETHVIRTPGKSVIYHNTREAPVYIPAKFSVVLGSGRDSDAPYPYFPREAVEGMALEYIGSRRWRRRLFDRSPPLAALGANAERRSGSLAVLGATSASSAFMGGLCMSDSLSSVQGLLSSQFSPFAALTANAEDVFSTAVAAYHDLSENGVSRGRLRVAARRGLVAVIDSCYTDSTGVAQAVSSGADEVSMVIYTFDHLRSLFHNAPGSRESLGMPVLSLPIFAEDVAPDMFEDTQVFQNAPGSTHLERLSLFTVHGTTVGSELYSIVAGRTITLRVALVETHVSIGGLDDYENYCALSQELVQTILSESNADVVDNWLLKYF